MLRIAIIKRDLGGANAPGQVYAMIPMIYIGRLTIRMVIALAGTRRVLSNEFEIEEDPFPKGILIEL